MVTLRNVKHAVMIAAPILVTAGTYVAGFFAPKEVNKIGEGYKEATGNNNVSDGAALVATTTLATAGVGFATGLVEGLVNVVREKTTAINALKSTVVYTIGGAAAGAVAGGTALAGKEMANLDPETSDLKQKQVWAGIGLGLGGVAGALGSKALADKYMAPEGGHADRVSAGRAAAPAGQGRV